ncbi:MAG TPA: CHAT domain-containing protein, partial [Pyrinomonadaceae bacterium]|nr:CHAT domain-containing protein [Pyrinomonadaceae bacterium]
ASVLRIQRREQAKRQNPPNVLAILADPVYDAEDPRVVAVPKSAPGSTAAPQIGQGGPSRPSPANVGSRSKLRDYDASLPEGVALTRLIFSKHEADAILATVPSRKVLQAIGFSANLTAATNAQLSQYRIIHFATHAVINQARPQLSALVLSRVNAKGEQQDGLLFLHDIYDLQLNADIVVLSACQTGFGKNIKGEGLISLTRGFMYAGAKRVVASLWKVDDSATATLMAQFYKEMFVNGRRPAAALKEAQKYVSEQRRWRSPYFWAGFVLQGEWR